MSTPSPGEQGVGARDLESVIGALPGTSAEIRAIEDACQVPTYAKLGAALVRGEGSYVWDAEGKRYLDLYGGHAVALTGHCHPQIVAALRAQAGRLLFYSNLVYSDVRAVAVRSLVELAPAELGRVFLCNSGAEANETALKIARKYTGRMRVVSMNEGFHGRTLGCLGATGIPTYRDPAYPIPTEHTYVPFGEAAALEEALDDDVAAVILEPIPSMGGIREAAPAYFHALRELCTRHGALLIFDEVQTGFGRTGTAFYGERVGVTPDLITGAKGIASGFPAGVVFVREGIGAAMKTGEQGTTFGGGPLASVAIAATAKILRDEDLPGNATRVGDVLRAALSEIDGVEETTGAGLLVGIGFDRPAKPLCRALIEQGILTGTAGGNPNQMRLLPPLTLSEDEALSWLPALRTALAASSPGS